MSIVVKTYFDKNNTLIRNSLKNTGRNPVAELFYGGEDDVDSNTTYSRFIFKFDESRIRDLYSGGTFPDLSKLKHTLKLKNTGSFDEGLLNQDYTAQKHRTSSFDLILFDVDQDWDEGVGYDLVRGAYIGQPISISTEPSNWVYAQTNTKWNNGAGVYSGSPTNIINTQHFDKGNEDLEMDVTDAVNRILTGDTNHGFGIAYPRTLEQTPTNQLQYVGFFTRHTQTIYEPHLETVYEETIRDDRHAFYLDKPNKLYLYSNLGGEPTNLDHKPSVDVYDHEDNLFSSFTQSAVTHVTKGVYSIDIMVPTTSNYQDCFIFTDKWKNIQINGVNRPDIELEFPLKDSMDYYNIDDNEDLPKEYSFSVHGIDSGEKIIRGDMRKVFIEANIPYTINQKELLDSLKYRIYAKEGRNEITIIDYQDVEMTNKHNYFFLDTISLPPTTYYLEIKAISNMETRTIKDLIDFDIVSRSELRESQ